MVTVDYLEDGILANTYVVGNYKSCIVIDPAQDLRNIIKLINGRKLSAVLLTHGHYDHFASLDGLLNRMNVATYMHKNAFIKLANKELSCAIYFGENKEIKKEDYDFKAVSDNMVIDLDGIKVKVLYTPGHTNCSVTYLIDDLMFSGDTLFLGGVGRWDLPTGAKANLMLSINKLFALNQDYQLFPGHGDASTLNVEKKDAIYQKIFQRS